MIRIDRQEGTLLVLVATGKLRAADYDAVLPGIGKQIADHGRLRCLLDVRGLEGLEPRAWLEEARFDWEHRRDFERCAVLGDRSWERLATQLSAPLFSGEVRYYDADHAEDALHWVEG
jgi:hypothetical protein